MSYCWNLQGDLQARTRGGALEPVEQGPSEVRAETRQIDLRRIMIDGELRPITIRLVEVEAMREAARDLINHRYVRKGYGDGHRIPASAHHMTFTAEIAGNVVGTITLAVDSERGLASDSSFRDLLDEVRNRPGRRICELTKFAFREDVRSRELMAALFHIVFVYGQRTFDCTDLFIEVHPRHVRFYETMLGFKRVGPMRVNESVGAALQLMSLEVAEIRRQVDVYGAAPQDRKRQIAARRSLYPLFFSPADEGGIYQRLARAERQRISLPVQESGLPH